MTAARASHAWGDVDVNQASASVPAAIRRLDHRTRYLIQAPERANRRRALTWIKGRSACDGYRYRVPILVFGINREVMGREVSMDNPGFPDTCGAWQELANAGECVMSEGKGFVPARRLLAALLLCAASMAAWAGPPFRTDDPEAVEYQHAEAYVFYQQTLAAEGRTGFLPAFEFNYGIWENVQLHLVAPLAFSTPSGMGATRGYGDTELGVKWQLNEETDSLPMIGIFPLVELPTGNSDKGLGNGHTQVFIPVWLQKKWGDFQTYGGGGYWINNGADNRNYWFFGWQAQYQFSEHVTLGAEVFHTTGQVVGQGDSTGFNVGGYYNVDEHNHVLFSAGKGLQNAAETNRVSSYVGYQYTF